MISASALKKMSAGVLLSVCTLFPLFSLGRENILDAVRLAYDFQFTQARSLVQEYRKLNPDDPYGVLGEIVYDFLMISQDPSETHFQNINALFDSSQDLFEKNCRNEESPENCFLLCFLYYYRMKSAALEEHWLTAMDYAVKARKLARELQDHLENYPDLYFILGDQDYSTALAPDSLKPFLKILDFSPDRFKGFRMLKDSAEKGMFTRYEASLMLISASGDVESEYSGALERTRTMLEDFPGNQSLRFYNMDLMLRRGEIDAAEVLLRQAGVEISSGILTGKWIPRYIQMQGNLANARGDYRLAVELYRKALEYPEISGYSATEIELETGKLLDILGRRREAASVFRDCSRGNGLILHREQARELRKTGYNLPRGSY